MEALGSLNPVDKIKGEIQAKVATFLGKKADLNRLRANPMLNIKEEAEKLYVQQEALEGELAITLENIKIMSAGPWDMSGVVKIGAFSWEMVQHINNVKDLQLKVQTAGPTQATTGSVDGVGDFITSPLGLGLIGVGLVFLLKR